DGDERPRIPRAGPLILIQRPVVEAAEPPRHLRVQPPFLRRAGFEAITPPLVRARRDDHAAGDLDRLDEPFAGRVRVELRAVAAAEAPVDRRPEHAVALPLPGEIGRE